MYHNILYSLQPPKNRWFSALAHSRKSFPAIDEISDRLYNVCVRVSFRSPISLTSHQVIWRFVAHPQSRHPFFICLLSHSSMGPLFFIRYVYIKNRARRVSIVYISFIGPHRHRSVRDGRRYLTYPSAALLFKPNNKKYNQWSAAYTVYIYIMLHFSSNESACRVTASRQTPFSKPRNIVGFFLVIIALNVSEVRSQRQHSLATAAAPLNNWTPAIGDFGRLWQ